MPLSDIRADSLHRPRAPAPRAAARAGSSPAARRCASSTTAASFSAAATRRSAVDPGSFETGLICLKGDATVTAARRIVRDAAVRRALRAADDAIHGHARSARRRLRRARGDRRGALPRPVRAVRRRPARSRPPLQCRRPDDRARSQHSHRQERRGRPHPGGRDVQQGRQLDVVAAARARRDARRGVPLHRDAGARVRRAARLHGQAAIRSSRRSSARTTSC